MKTIYLYNTKTSELLTLNVSNYKNYKHSEEYVKALSNGAQEIKLIDFFDLDLFSIYYSFKFESSKTMTSKVFGDYINSKNFYGYKSCWIYFKTFLLIGESSNYIFVCKVNYFNTLIKMDIDQINENFLLKNEKSKVLENFNDFLDFNSDFYNRVWHLPKEHADFLSSNHFNNNILSYR